MPQTPVVMVVEDDREMNDLQRELLAAYGLDAVAAYSGLQALEVFDEASTDAILLDVMLPEMDGFETCHRLRQRGATRPIVMITALDNDDCRRRGFEAGADAYFTKPFNPEEVIGAIQELIDQRRTPPTGAPPGSPDDE